MAASEIYRLEIPIIVDDQTGPAFQQIQRKVNQFEKSAQKTNDNVRRMFGRDIRIRIGAIDRAWPVVQRVQSSLRSVTGKVWTVTLQAKDKVTGTIKNIISKVTSPLALLGAGAGVGAGIYGLGKLTIGPAAQFERYSVSMEHWLKGNKTLAQETMKWAEEFADITPFTAEDIFPGMARAINVSKGAVEPAKRLVKLSAEMAALTPGKTILDAMEAFADAQTGEFERMKEFGMKIRKEEFEAIGGWEGFLRKAEATFSGGVERLSKTSTGLLSTILDKIQKLFRSAGRGMLDAIKPRLEEIVKWLDKNKATVEKWSKSLALLGKEAFEKIFFWGEIFLNKINKKLESPELKNADWGTKIIAVLDEAAKIVLPKAGEMGIKLGIEIGKGLGKGIAKAAAEDPLVGLILGAWLGTKVPGPIPVKIAAGLTVAVVPQIVKGAEAVTKKTAPAFKKIEESPVYKKVIKPPPEEERKEHWLYKLTKALGGEVHAKGGILTKPHLGLVAEAGPEAIIPLTKPAQAFDMWKNVGDYMSFFEDKKVAYNAPLKFIEQKLKLSIPVEMLNKPVSESTKSISGSLRKLQTETRRIVIQGSKSINQITSVYKNISEMMKNFNVPEQFQNLVPAIAGKFGIPAGILSRLIQAESGWRPGAVSPAGAIGLTQVMPGTASGMGYSLSELRNNPLLQIEAGARYLAMQYHRFKSWPLALAAYNAGPGAVEKYGGVPPYRETQNYVSKILSSKYASGGILTKPHLGLVAEAGPEAVIPLSTRMRGRALSLYEEAGRHLGIRPYAEGGLAGTIPTAVPAMAGVGGFPPATINLNFDLDGLVSQVVIENRDDIDGAVDRITGAIADNLRGVFQNMTKK